jgi:cellulose synthase/poly-beta-1,6-N-acetylglucosamine synthase-like glycosyltransferase
MQDHRSHRRNPFRAVPHGISVAVAGYLTLLTGAAWWAKWKGRTRTTIEPSPNKRFVVMIPAHNEEELIGRTLDSLAAANYPSGLIQVHVAADNCNDNTVSIARARNVEVHERWAPHDGGKGPALQWLWQELRARAEPIDGVVIIDADTTVGPEFFRVMASRLSQGQAVIQSYYAVSRPESSDAAAFRAAALAVRHYLRPLGRTQLGGTAGLHGNGMVFTPDVLDRQQWSNHLTEDIELQLELLLDGVLVDFAPDAEVHAEMPDTIDGSRTQHERWERGRVDLARRYVPTLMHHAVTSKAPHRVACVDAAVDQLLPPLSITAMATAVWLAAGAGLAHRNPDRATRAIKIGLVLLVVQAAHVGSALHMVKAPLALYRSLIRTPRMVAWKTALWLRILVRPSRVAWVRTARNAERLAAVRPSS